MDKELIVNIYCAKCDAVKGSVYSVPASMQGVRMNVAEPSSLGAYCPDCNHPLTQTRVEGK